MYYLIVGVYIMYYVIQKYTSQTSHLKQVITKIYGIDQQSY